MTIWCNTCRCLVRAPCTSHRHHRPVDQRNSVCRSFRSTKGASKARRDHINHEIRNMRSLLPISQEDQERLSYLHSMAAICTYIRKTVLFQGLVSGGRTHSHSSLPYQAFLQALHGFVLVTTAQGKLVYVSENVSDYLGLSMIDVLQGDTFCDIVESSDADVVKANMDLRSSGSAQRSFVCCLQTSKAFKLQHGGCCSMLVEGSFRSFPQPPSLSRFADQPLFVALCTPTVDRLQSDNPRCHSFSSVHRLDMSFTQVSDSVLYFLGYSNEEMEGRSWYSLVHPEDLSSTAESHQRLVQADEGSQVEMVLRLQCKDLAWTWIYSQAKKYPDSQGFTCQNFIISETEARFLQTRISGDAFRPSHQADSCSSAAQQSPQRSSSCRSFKRQRSSNSPSEELPAAKATRPDQDRNLAACMSFQSDGSPVPLLHGAPLFTPPCSPVSSSSSSCSPVQQEELSHDLLIDTCGCTDQLLSSPEGSPSYFPYPEAVPTCHLSAPNSAGADQTFEQAAFSVLGDLASPSASSPTCYFQACTPDAPLVPDCLSMCDTCDILLDCALHQDDFSPLEQPQGGSEVQAHYVPHRVFPALSGLPTPGQSPSSAESDRYNEREQVEISILAQQISSLASSFTKHHTLSPLQNTSQPSWPNHGPPHHSSSDLILDDGVFDLILDDLDLVPGKSSYTYQQSIPDVLPPAEHLAALDAFSLQMGHHGRRAGLHQPSRYIRSDLQPEGFAEESLY